MAAKYDDFALCANYTLFGRTFLFVVFQYVCVAFRQDHALPPPHCEDSAALQRIYLLLYFASCFCFVVPMMMSDWLTWPSTHFYFCFTVPLEMMLYLLSYCDMVLTKDFMLIIGLWFMYNSVISLRAYFALAAIWRD